MSVSQGLYLIAASVDPTSRSSTSVVLTPWKGLWSSGVATVSEFYGDNKGTAVEHLVFGLSRCRDPRLFAVLSTWDFWWKSGTGTGFAIRIFCFWLKNVISPRLHSHLLSGLVPLAFWEGIRPSRLNSIALRSSNNQFWAEFKSYFPCASITCIYYYYYHYYYYYYFCEEFYLSRIDFVQAYVKFVEYIMFRIAAIFELVDLRRVCRA